MKSAMKPLEITLAAGCAQQSDEYASPAGVRTATNLRMLKRGGLSKRPGARGLAGTTSQPSRTYITGNGTSTYVESPAFMATVGDAAFVATTSGEGFALDEVQGSLFEAAGAYATAVPVRKRRSFGSVLGVATGVKPAAVATSSAGYVMIATLYSTSLVVAIETPAGTRIFELRESGVVQVRCHAVGARLYVVWQDGSSIKTRAYQPNGTNENAVAAATLDTLYDSTYHWDTSAYDGTHWFLIHGTGSDDLQVTKFAGTTSVATASFSTTAIEPTPCSIWADAVNGNVWVGYYDNPGGLGGVNYRVYAASDLSEVKGETTLNNGTAYGPPLFGPHRNYFDKAGDASSAFYVYRYAETSSTALVRATYTGYAYTDSTPSSSGLPTHGVLPISKPDSRQRVWCIVDNGSAQFATARIALLRFYQETRDPPAIDLTLPSMIAPGASVGPVNSPMYFHAPAVGASVSIVAMPRVLTVLDGTPYTTVEVVEYATSEQAPWRSTRQGAPGLVVAGSPVEYFGTGYGRGHSLVIESFDYPNFAGAVELGFLHGPTITDAAYFGSGSVGVGKYAYRAIYEWDDAYGRIHRSEPSAPYSITLTSAGGVRLTITSLDASQRQTEATWSKVRVVVYRTLAGGATYQRVFDNYAVGSGFIVFDDTAADSTVADEEFIYTDGGVLPNEIAPSCRYLARSEDRLWFGGLFNPNVIQCSKVIVPEEPIQCTDHPSHQVVLPGECTGLAYMDGNIAAFTRNSILLISSGGGPNDQGQGEFAPPRIHTTGLGCVDGRSVLETPEGIFFLSQRGIELLPRGFGAVSFIGEAIKDLVQTSLLDQCGFAAYQADKNGSYARFGLLAGSSEFSVPSVRYIATYDLNTQQWFIDDYGPETMGALGAWPSGFALIRTDLDSDTSPTPIWYEDGSLVSQPATSGAAHIVSAITCQKLMPFGQGGHGHIRRIVLTFVSHVANWKLSVMSQTDDNTPKVSTWQITTTGLLRREVVLPFPRCSVLSLSVGDSDYGGNGAKQAATYLGFAIEADPLEGARGLAEGEKS